MDDKSGDDERDGLKVFETANKDGSEDGCVLHSHHEEVTEEDERRIDTHYRND